MVCPTCGATALRRHCASPLIPSLTAMGEVGSSRNCNWVVCTRCSGYGHRNLDGAWSAGRPKA